MKKELLIHFNDANVCLDILKELGIKISTRCKNFILLLHNSVEVVNEGMPQNISADICFRTANRILKVIEMETDVRFVRYKKHNYDNP